MARRTTHLIRRLRLGAVALFGGASLVLALHSPAAAALTPSHLVNAYTTIQGAPSQGLSSITYPIRVDSQPNASGYFFAQSFFFKGGQQAYTGLQPRPGGGRAYFSVFGEGASTADANCAPGADGGPGVTCSTSYPYTVGRTYHLTVRGAGGSKWEGVVTDTVTGSTTHIGSWTISSGQGLLDTFSIQFTEYYLSVANCDALPHAQAFFANPKGNGGAYTGPFSSGLTLGTCKSKAGYTISGSGLTTVTGG
ncbi:hypothetical protein [Streptomyces sp. NBC_01304]|uniref:hypothetical protein n=1 Tax=Streptomyces sp. NBC_01304 TaxID=2903818 RepID=UPI002E1347A8|nr:hypothetical protein OG430_46040 [Streptomyces sp. NBC_01304]